MQPPPALEWSEEQTHPIDPNQLASQPFNNDDDEIVDENKEYIKIG